jgi:hemerythrin-like domain-containing protein
MGLSSNTIIHFTKNFQSLKGILENNFKIFYCREKIKSNNVHIDYLVPMVSFCDIPLSQVLNHINSYGCYGIGLKKSWAEKEGLNPVLYIERNSILSKSILTDLLTLLKNGKNKINELNVNERKAYDIVRYLKNYEDDLDRGKGKIVKNYRFSDEREWRYVINPIDEHTLIANLKNFKENEIKNVKNEFNEKIKQFTLNFAPEDINYIIIKSEKERDAILNLIERVKGKNSLEEVKRLTSRIISVEQLKTDF